MSNLGTLGSLFVDLAANTATFESDMGRAARISEKHAREIGKQFDEMGKAIGIAMAATATVVAAGVKRAINEADELAKAAQKTGVAVDKLSKIRFAAQLGDVDFEPLEQGLLKLNRATVDAQRGNKDLVAAFAAVGISVEDLARLRPDQLLELIADAFEGAQDDANKSAVAMALLGKSGADLIPFLNGGSRSIRQYGDELERLHGVIGDEFSQSAQNINDNLTRLQKAADGAFLKIASDLSPQIERLTDLFADPEFQQSLSTAIQNIADLTAKMAAAAATAARLYLAFRGGMAGAAVGSFFGPIGTVIGAAAGVALGGNAPELAGSLLPDPLPRGSDGDPGTRTRQMTALALSINAVQAKINSGESFRAGTLEADAKALEALTEQYKALAGPVAEAEKRSLGYAGAQDQAAKRTKAQISELERLAQTLTEQVLTPEEAYAKQLADLDKAYNANLISAETRTRQLGRMAEEFYANVVDVTGATEEQLALADELAKRFSPQATGLNFLRDLISAKPDSVDATVDYATANENNRYDLELKEFEKAKEGILERGYDYDKLLQDAAKNHQMELSRIEREGNEQRRRLQLQQVDASANAFGAMADAAAVFGEKGFRAYKAFKIAETLISTYSSATKAFESLSSIPYVGPALGGAAAAAAVVSGLANVAAIRSMNYGGGRANGGPTLAGSIYEVGEMNRPELAYFQGKQYLIPGNQGGTVRPLDTGARAVAPAQGGGGGIKQVVLAAPGLTWSEQGGVMRVEMVPDLLRLAENMSDQKIRRDVRRGTGVGADIGSTYGVQRKQQRSLA